MSRSPEPLPFHYRWNFRMLMVGYISFGTGITFISVSTVLPALAGELTRSAPLIGLVSTIFSGSWFLPQLLVARVLHGKPRQKPYLMIGVAGRLALPVVAVALWGGLAKQPMAMLALCYACIGLFMLFDAFGSVPWFDIVARTIPASRRGRLVGISQVVVGVLGIGVGALVGLIMVSPRLPFPNNYALLFLLATIGFIPSSVALAFLREPPPEERRPAGDAAAMGGRELLKPLADAEFRRFVACRLMVGMVDMAIPFFVGHAEGVLRLPRGMIGGFVIAQTLGGIVASGALGLVSERWGTRNVIRIGSAVTVLGPLLALAAHLAHNSILSSAYPLVYFTLGVMNAIRMLGFSNYLLEIAPADRRPTYVGLANTLGGAVMFVPMLGGWLLQATSYSVLFGATAILLATGFVLSLGLRADHRRPNAG
jgi:MFS family permease